MRWTNLEVRKLLRLSRRPELLERERLAVLLRVATQTTHARAALEQVVEAAFDRTNSADRLRLEIIERCDMNGETTRQAARALHLSVRQFFRHRADAIDAITQSIEKALRRPPDSQSHLLSLAHLVETIDPKAARDIYQRAPAVRGGKTAFDIVRTSLWAGTDVSQDQIDACEGPWGMLAQAAVARHLVSRGENERAARIRDELRVTLQDRLGPRYAAAAFELTLLDRCEASRRGDASESRALVERLHALAGRDESLMALAMISESDQALTDGDITAAAVALNDVELLDIHASDLNIMARTALGKAMLSHVRGFHEDAFALANGAAPVIAALEGGFALRAAGIAGRAALLCGAPWTSPNSLIERYPKVWTRALVDAVASRHRLATDALAARVLAASALRLATERESPLLVSYAQVSLAGALDVLGNEREAQRLRIAAWQSSIRCRDEFALYDLFCHPHAPAHELGCMRLDEAFASAYQTYLSETTPAFTALIADRAARTDLVAEVLRAAVRAPVSKADSVSNHARVEVAGLPSARAAAFCLAPQARPHFEHRFAIAWDSVINKIASPTELERARAV
ncbi:MAG: hypothetical protein M3Z41_06720 [Candidatus Eremiobacteraeota bacterium]|nr:hypothetical protein [Candidatus Eremiobacteraeota bacterium]